MLTIRSVLPWMNIKQQFKADIGKPTQFTIDLVGDPEKVRKGSLRNN